MDKVLDMETNVRQPSERQRELLQKKNCLLNVLGEDGGGNIVVCGDTSVGKSTVINFLLGFPLNLEAMGVGTRRPCVLSQVHAANAEILSFRVSFMGKEVKTTDMMEVARAVAEANKEAGDSFDDVPVFVEMHHKSFLEAMRFVDLPGLIHPSRPNADIVKSLALKYLKPENTVVVVLGRDNWANGGTHMLCDRIKGAKKVIFVQNFAYNEWSIRAAQQRQSDVRETMGASFDYVLVDMGPPGGANPGQWDQQDWKKMANETDPMSVRVAMAEHAERFRQRLRNDFAADLANTTSTMCGIRYVQNQLVNFSLEGLENIINEMHGAIQKKIEREKEREKRLKEEAKVLNDTPSEWQELVDGIAGSLSKYFDTTAQQVDFAAGREPHEKKSCMKTDRELKAPGIESWFAKNSTFDQNLVKLLDTVSREYNPSEEIACLRSWYRLLDEFTGALCFASMRKIDSVEIQTTRLQFQQTGMRQESLVEDRILQLITSDDGTGRNKRLFIDEMLRKFQKRLLMLVKRDVEDAIKILEQDRDGFFANLATALEKQKEEKELKKLLLERVKDIAYEHAQHVLEKDIEAMCRTTGLPGGAKGPLEWLVPFKKHYLNGQLPWKLLTREPGPEGTVPELLRPIDPSVDKTSIVTMADGHINATNHVNLLMFKLATEVYDVNIPKSDPSIEKSAYTLEVLKLLQMMQGEMSTFALAETQTLLRRLNDLHRLSAYISKEIEKEGAPQEVAMVLSDEEVRSMITSILNFTFHPEQGILRSVRPQDGWTSENELNGAKNDPPPNCPKEFVCWPSVKEEQYASWVAEEAQLQGHAAPIFGSASWNRLAEEFVAVNMMLSTKEVNFSELVMAQASSGHSLYAGVNEIVEKLALHRLEELSLYSGDVYHLRQMTVYTRDMNIALNEWTRQYGTGVKGSKEVVAWLLSHASPLYSHANEELVSFKGRMQLKFKELFPFDFSTMNGRFPFLDVNDLQEPGDEVETLVANTLYPDIVPVMAEGVEETAGEVRVNQEIRKKAKRNVSYAPQPGDVQDNDKEFNMWALKYFKAIHATAVDYCRPKLKKTMAKMYQHEELRRALVSRMGFSEFFGDVRRAKLEQLRKCSGSLDQMQKEFQAALSGVLSSSEKSHAQELAESNMKMSKELDEVKKSLANRKGSALGMKMRLAAQMQQRADAQAKLAATEVQNQSDMAAVKQVMQLLGSDGGEPDVQALVPKIKQIVKSLSTCQAMAHQAVAYNRLERLSCYFSLHVKQLQVNLVGTDTYKCGISGYNIQFPGLPIGDYSADKPPCPNFDDSAEGMKFLETSHDKKPPLHLWSQTQLPRTGIPGVNPIDEHCIVLDVWGGWMPNRLTKRFEKLFSVRAPVMYAYKSHANSLEEIKKGLGKRGELPPSDPMGFKVEVEKGDPAPEVTYTFKPASFHNVHELFKDKLGACELKVTFMHQALN